MVFPLAAVTLGAQLLVAVADRVPQFNVEPSCRAAAESGATVRKDASSCLKDEREARDQLSRQWSSFPAGDRTRCAQLTQTGGPPSYVEVLTCLEMARDARNLPKKDFGNT